MSQRLAPDLPETVHVATGRGKGHPTVMHRTEDCLTKRNAVNPREVSPAIYPPNQRRKCSDCWGDSGE